MVDQEVGGGWPKRGGEGVAVPSSRKVSPDRCVSAGPELGHGGVL